MHFKENKSGKYHLFHISMYKSLNFSRDSVPFGHVSFSDLLKLSRILRVSDTIMTSDYDTRSWCPAGQRVHDARAARPYLKNSILFLPYFSTVPASWSCLPFYQSMQRLVSENVLSRFDYCNSQLVILLSTTLDRLQRIIPVSVHLITGLGPWDHMTEQTETLHLLSIRYWINFK